MFPKRRRTVRRSPLLKGGWALPSAGAYRDMMRDIRDDLDAEPDDRTDESDLRAYAWWPYHS